MNETIQKLLALPTGTWFTVKTSKGDVTEILKELIDNGEHFEFSNDWTRFKRLQDFNLIPSKQTK